MDVVRGWVARIASLRWTRIGPVDAAVPVGMAIVATAFVDQLGRPIGGLPFGLIWIVATAAAVAVVRIRPVPLTGGRSRPGPAFVALVAWVVVGWLLFDVLLWQQINHLYDFDVYLASAGRWMSGGQPYMTAPVSAWPSSAAQDFFLYPPPLLPVFGRCRSCRTGRSRWRGSASWSPAHTPRFGSWACRPILEPAAAGLPAGDDRLRIGQRRQPDVPALRRWPIEPGEPRRRRPVQGPVRAPGAVAGPERRWRGLIFGLAAVAGDRPGHPAARGPRLVAGMVGGLGYRAASQAAVTSMFGYSVRALRCRHPSSSALAAGVVAAGPAVLAAAAAWRPWAWPRSSPRRRSGRTASSSRCRRS